MGRAIPFEIEQDEDQLEEALEFASKLVQSLQEYDEAAKKVITKDLLVSYNSGWNEYDIQHKDGSVDTVKNPELKPQEFESRFVLETLNIIGKDCVDFWYGESELFWGHSVFVTSLNGSNFSEAQAQLFG